MDVLARLNGREGAAGGLLRLRAHRPLVRLVTGLPDVYQRYSHAARDPPSGGGPFIQRLAAASTRATSAHSGDKVPGRAAPWVVAVRHVILLLALPDGERRLVGTGRHGQDSRISLQLLGLSQSPVGHPRRS